jgi:beta-glucanase (GH16 family)
VYNKLIWEQNFGNGTTSLSEWNIRRGNDLLDDNGNAVVPGWGNGEAQFYTGHEENLYLDEAGLNLCARLQTTEVDSNTYAHLQTNEVDSNLFAQPQSDECFSRRFLYTSARLDTRDRFSFCYGKLVVHAKLPVGHGLWPAIWMLPQARDHGPWPASGEIDVCEAKGRLPRHVFGTLHHGQDFESKITDEFSHELASGSIAEFREYSLEWSPDSIRWLVDGHCFAERRLEHGSAPFDVPFYLVLNLAVGGWYDQVEIDNTAFPAIMTVAGIWVYQ